MAYERRSYSDSATPTALTSGINATDLLITIDDPSGWPGGGAGGPFFACIGRETSSPELIEVESRTGNQLTVASTSKRGINGTGASTWAAGTTIEHVHTAQDADEANAHVTDTNRDDHTQYLNSARHASVTHTQPMLGSDSVGSAQIQAGAVGASELASSAVTTVKIQDGAVTGQKIASAAVDTAHLANGAVGIDKLDSGSVNQSKIAVNLALVHVAATEPTSSANGRLWFDTANRVLKVRNATDDGWEELASPGVYAAAKALNEAWVDYTPTVGGIFGDQETLIKWGRYKRFGTTAIVEGGFVLDGSHGVTGTITFSLPFPLKPYGPSDTGRWLSGARGTDVGGGSWASIGTVVPTTDDDTIVNFATAGSQAWGQEVPFPWNGGNGDRMDFFIVGEVDPV